jgi:hypothetical protein
MLPADSASRAGSTPEASGDWSSGTFGKNMTTLFKTFSTVIAIVCLSGPLRAEEIPVGGTSDPYTGKQTPYSIPTDVLKSLPTWNEEDKNIPLSMVDAIHLARQQAKKDYTDKIGELRMVLFTRRATKDSSLWAYSIGFRVLDAPDTRSANYLVLLNGYVVSPKK